MSVVSHISVGFASDKASQTVAFYDAVMASVGAKRQLIVYTDGSRPKDVNEPLDEAKTLAGIGYGKYYPEFWIQLPHDKKEATPGNGTHVSFFCKNKNHVKAVYDAALAHGGTCNGKPGPREEYSDKYYGAFFIDPTGNKLEATFFDMGIWNYCAIL